MSVVSIPPSDVFCNAEVMQVMAQFLEPGAALVMRKVCRTFNEHWKTMGHFAYPIQRPLMNPHSALFTRSETEKLEIGYRMIQTLQKGYTSWLIQWQSESFIQQPRGFFDAYGTRVYDHLLAKVQEVNGEDHILYPRNNVLVIKSLIYKREAKFVEVHQDQILALAVGKMTIEGAEPVSYVVTITEGEGFKVWDIDKLLKGVSLDEAKLFESSDLSIAPLFEYTKDRRKTPIYSQAGYLAVSYEKKVKIWNIYNFDKPPIEIFTSSLPVKIQIDEKEKICVLATREEVQIWSLESLQNSFASGEPLSAPFFTLTRKENYNTFRYFKIVGNKLIVAFNDRPHIRDEPLLDETLSEEHPIFGPIKYVIVGEVYNWQTQTFIKNLTHPKRQCVEILNYFGAHAINSIEPFGSHAIYDSSLEVSRRSLDPLDGVIDTFHLSSGWPVLKTRVLGNTVIAATCRKLHFSNTRITKGYSYSMLPPSKSPHVLHPSVEYFKLVGKWWIVEHRELTEAGDQITLRVINLDPNKNLSK